jgi:hypothetical protein
MSSNQTIEGIMTAAVSSTSTLSTTTISSAASSNSEAASLKAELAARQSELAQAKTDDEKSKINAEITNLKAEIAALKTTDQQDTSRATAKNGAGKTNMAQMTSADKAAPESKISDSAMDVLMRLGPQGGMMPPGGRNAAGGPPDISQIYADMDSDSDGKVTKDEFVAGSADHMSEDRASKLFASIDSQNTGSITEEQFAKSVMHGPEGGRPMGPPPGGIGAFQANQQAAATSANVTGAVTA